VAETSRLVKACLFRADRSLFYRAPRSLWHRLSLLVRRSARACPCTAMASFAEAPSGEKAKGEKIFKTKCAQCHVPEKGGGHKQVHDAAVRKRDGRLTPRAAAGCSGRACGAGALLRCGCSLVKAVAGAHRRSCQLCAC